MYYYIGNSKIDEHKNHTRQAVFQLEWKVKVKDWEVKVNHGIMGMHDVDTFRFGGGEKTNNSWFLFGFTSWNDW